MNKHFIKPLFVILLSLMALISIAKCELLEKSRAPQFNALHDSTILNKQNNNKNSTRKFSSDAAELGEIVFEYFRDVLNRDTINLSPGIAFERKSTNDSSAGRRQRRRVGDATSLVSQLRQFTNDHVLTVNLARASTETARLFFFKGLKKFMWPLFIGLQVVKTALLVLFLPSIIGSVGKIVGKGLPSLSGTFSQFSQPAANVESVDDLDFKDNSANSDHESEGTLNSVYQYAIPDSKNNFASQMYQAAATNNAISRLGLDKVTLVERTKNNGFAAKRDDFKIFHDIPSSSHLLMNYDPFYSPLLSRLDAIFQQLGLATSSDEKCREKLVCLMYSNPAKYAPYSNLVSAQLSRELNELRKPTSDNPDILRFFRYMRAAKDGQDGLDCELSYKECTTFTDMSGPAMVNTFNDINKLVSARKMRKL